MTPAELAKYSAISFECKKDSLRQTQTGTWKIAFTVQGLDMDERLTKAFPGTRYMAVLVEVDDLEMPVHQPAKESSATPEVVQDKPPLPAKRMEWRELQPAAQAGIRCGESAFSVFLKEQRPEDWREEPDPVDCVYLICGITSRSELGTNHKARVLWHQLDEQFQVWKYQDA